MAADIAAPADTTPVTDVGITQSYQLVLKRIPERPKPGTAS
jgi:hypothetical protein